MTSSPSSRSSSGVRSARASWSVGDGGGDGVRGDGSRGGRMPCLRRASLLGMCENGRGGGGRCSQFGVHDEEGGRGTGTTTGIYAAPTANQWLY